MSEDDIKKYTVIVNEGSGCLFQPMNTNEYTYVLTAKHLFEGEKKDENGRTIQYSTNDGDSIKIIQLILNEGTWEESPIDFTFQKGINYFIHEDADAAILKIDYKPEFEKIIVQNKFEGDTGFVLSGCPNTFREASQKKTNWQTTYGVKRFKASGDYCHGAQLFEGLNQTIIQGMSGGPILKCQEDFLAIAGIQSKMANKQFPVGEIGFIPIQIFNEIIEENVDVLTPLLPPYMASFSNLRNEVLKLEEAFDANFRSKMTNALNQKIPLIEVCPNDLYNSKLKAFLLANNESETTLLTKEIWISWFEYLIVLSILKDKNIDIKEIESFYNEKRLIHSGTDKSWIQILPEILNSNLDNMVEDGVLLVSTKKGPMATKRIGEGLIRDISSPNVDMSIDRAEQLKSLKEIIHIKAFEIDCIIANQKDLSGFDNLQIKELLDELKNKIYEFFKN
ncbi:MAG: ABC-three component system protein [Bacteroidota bacterium]